MARYGRTQALLTLVLTLWSAGCAHGTAAGGGGAEGPPPRAQPTAAAPTPSAPPRLEDQRAGTTALLQAVSVVDSNVVWVSGHRGTYARTTDGGRTWAAATVPDADTLQFRDVHALDARTAWLLSAGPGDLSRIYRTDDAGAHWTLQWVNDEPAGFYDCLDFWDASRGVAYGDAVDGTLRVLRTEDGGAHWSRVPADALPLAQAGEGGFAASGTCVTTGAGGRAWIAAGNAEQARVFRTTDYGRTWLPATVPLISGEGAGATSVSMADDAVGTVFGGNLGMRDLRTDDVARTTDGGATWTPLPHVALTGAVYGGVHVPGTGARALIAVGPGGADASRDGGTSWATFDTREWWGLGSAGAAASWIVGPEGRIARVRLP